MIVSKPDLRMTRSLELLANLKQTVTKFVKREEQIARDLGARRMSTTRKSQDAIRHTDTKLERVTAETEEHFTSEQARIKARYEARRTRVQKYRAAALKSLPRRAQEAKGRWMGDLQMKNFLAQKKMEADLAAATGSFTNFTTKLDVNKDMLKRLEARARKDFAGYGSFKKLLKRKTAVTSEQFNDLSAHFANADGQLDAFENFPLARFFGVMQLPLLVLIFVMLGAGVAFYFGFSPIGNIIGGVAAIALTGIFSFIYAASAKKSKPVATTAADAVVQARAIMAAGTAAVANASGSLEQERQRIQQEFEHTAAGLQAQWGRTNEIEGEFEDKARTKLETQTPRILSKIDKALEPKLARLEAERAARLGGYTTEADSLKQQYTASYTTEATALAAEEKSKWDEITADWKKEITPIYADIHEMKLPSPMRYSPHGPAVRGKLDSLRCNSPPPPSSGISTWTSRSSRRESRRTRGWPFPARRRSRSRSRSLIPTRARCFLRRMNQAAAR